jgi:hypothetical protein
MARSDQLWSSTSRRCQRKPARRAIANRAATAFGQPLKLPVETRNSSKRHRIKPSEPLLPRSPSSNATTSNSTLQTSCPKCKKSRFCGKARTAHIL